MRRLLNSFVLALLTAVLTAISGHFINQLPEVPDKEKNVPWIVAVVVVATLAVGILAFLQQSPIANRAGGMAIRGNKMIGDGNNIQLGALNVDVSDNLMKGDNNSITAENNDLPDNL